MCFYCGGQSIALFALLSFSHWTIHRTPARCPYAPPGCWASTEPGKDTGEGASPCICHLGGRAAGQRMWWPSCNQRTGDSPPMWPGREPPWAQETWRLKAQRTEEWVRAGQPWELPVTRQKAETEYIGWRQARAGGNPELPEPGWRLHFWASEQWEVVQRNNTAHHDCVNLGNWSARWEEQPIWEFLGSFRSERLVLETSSWNRGGLHLHDTCPCSLTDSDSLWNQHCTRCR